jgi:hypothetical protein
MRERNNMRQRYAIDNEDDLDEDIERMMSEESMSKSEAIVASRKYKLANMPDEYKEAISTLSYRVACPRCRMKKGQHCKGNVHNGAPAHKPRLQLLKFKNRKVYDNLRYAMNSWQECDWHKLVKEMKEYDESGEREKNENEYIEWLEGLNDE